MTPLNEELIRKALTLNIASKDEFLQLKRELARQYKRSLPSNIALFGTYTKLIDQNKIKPNAVLETILQKNKIRSISGVTIITCITKDYPCPGSCLYCPKEANIPQSYLSDEPAIMRAVMVNFDPFSQVKTRLEALRLQNHPRDKIELIILGGTFSALPKRYRENFVKRCLDALNGRVAKDLRSAKKMNEKARHRCIGLTIETRPDFINKKEIEYLRYLGVTRVELGVQSTFDNILQLNKRGHKVADTIQATKLLKDAGMKVGYHIMPGLYGSNPQKDLEIFKTIFDDQRFRPDYLKIYPCVVVKEAPLYRLWQRGKYIPYNDKELISLLIKIKRLVPFYVRIHRLIRDIPSSDIVAGNKITKLRQILKERKVRCRCIRCREIKDKLIKEKPVMFRWDYQASGGREVFLSFETKERRYLLALLRLRIPAPGDTFLPSLRKAGIIREVHTYGPQVAIGERKNDASQHKNLGKKLIKEAEKIIKEEFKLPKIAVTSGIGARDYYRKLGYELENEYMSKRL